MIRKVSIAVLVILLSGGLFMFFGSEPEYETSSQASDSQAITYDSVATEVDSGDAVLLDVRTPAEYEEGFVAPAENYPLQLLEQNQLPDISKDKTIYLYCRTGSRSAQADSLLRQAGYKNVVDLGGLSDMIAIGGELTTD